jgi:hypothetical protein
MPVANEIPIQSALANGVTTVFPYGFTVLSSSDLIVQGKLAGVVTTYTLGVDYTLTGVGSSAGSVVFGVAPANGTTIVVYRDSGLKRDTDYQNNGDLRAQTLDADFDRIWLALQEIFSGGKGPPTALRVPNGETVSALPAAADRASRVLAFDSLGVPVVLPGVDSSSATALALDLLNVVSATKGAALSGFNGALNYVGQTLGRRILAIGADPRALGAPANGVGDDSPYWTAALLYSKTLDVRNGTWKLNSTVSCIAGLTIDARGATVNLNTGATPGLQQLNGNAGLTIHGGLWQGTASSWLFLQGKTTTPALQTDYASLINLIGVQVSSATITTAIVMDKAVKSFNAWGCNFFTPNGVNSNAKSVEINFTDCIIYSATGAAGTRGIKLRSPGGTTFYNEGWSIATSTVDNFEISHDVTDVFVYQVVGGYHGVNAALSATTGYAFQFQAPSTNLCEELILAGAVVIGGRIRFVASAGGQAYNSLIDATFNGVPGTAIAIENNAANITIRGKWKGGSGTAVGVVGTNNNANINVSGDFDSTYTNGVILNGANGANCVVGPLSGPVTGDMLGLGRIVQGRGIPISTAAVAALKQAFSPANLGGGATYTVGSNIASFSPGFVKGETGDIVINLSYSGANAGTQNVQIGVPAGMVLGSGTGYSAANLYLGAATGLLSVRVPYYCTADGVGAITVLNQAGNTLTINNQGYCGIERNW